MFLASLIFAFVFAIFFASLLSFGFKRKAPGPGNGLLFFFVIIFLFSWGIGSWIAPFGPQNWGVPWIGYLFTAILVMLLIGVLLPPSQPRSRARNAPASDEELFHKPASAYPLSVTIGIFFWILIITLLFVVIAKMLWS